MLALTHTLIYNRTELRLGISSFWNDFKRYYYKFRGKAFEGQDIDFGDDVHYRLMQAYPEVPEWWFAIITLISMLMGFVALGVYTNVSPAVVMMAPIITIIFLIPVGIVTSVSGMEPSLNIISELIGGAFAAGDTMTVQFFRMYGVRVYHPLFTQEQCSVSAVP
jgi:hypothetical protein